MSSVYIPIVKFLNELYAPFGSDPLPVPTPWARVLTAAFTPDARMKLPYTTVVLSAPKKCLGPDEPIWAAKDAGGPFRLTRVGDLVETEPYVWSWDGERWGPKLACVDPAPPARMLRFRLADGRSVVCSEDHPIHDGAKAWVRAGQIQVGQEVTAGHSHSPTLGAHVPVVAVERLGVGENVSVSVPGTENYLGTLHNRNSAKTSMSAGIALWFACCMSENYGEVIVSANKREQAKGRAFDFIRRAILNNPTLKRSFKVGQNVIESEWGTKIYPITTEAGGEAGANPELILHDELWNASTEADERLWAELTTVPTRRNSLRVITSYAGYLDYSKILYRVYEQAMKLPPHEDFLDMVGEDGEPVVRHDPVQRSFSFWETTQRMPWQQTPDGKKYYADEERTQRRSDFLRLHKNQWVSNEEGFDMDHWDACVDPDYDPKEEFRRGDNRLYISAGVDASYRKDFSAVVSVFKRDDRFWIGPYDIWAPKKGQEFDFETTIEAFILKLKETFRLREVYYDPYQMHRSAMSLRKRAVLMREWKQTEPNTKIMGTLLCDMLRDRRLVIPNDPILRHQAASTTLRLSPEGVQLKKDGRNKKIDAIIALSMACVAAQHLPDMTRSMKGQFVFV